MIVLPILAGTGVVDIVVGVLNRLGLISRACVGTGMAVATTVAGDAEFALSRSFRIRSLSFSRSLATESTKPATSVATALRSILLPRASARRLGVGVERERLSAGGKGLVAGGVYAENVEATGEG